MFFTKIGRVIAWLSFATGCLKVGLGFGFALLNNHALARRYLGTDTTGEAIDEGVFPILAGVALGILVEISRSVARKSGAAAQG